MVFVFSLGVWKIWVHAFGREFGGQKYAVLYISLSKNIEIR